MKKIILIIVLGLLAACAPVNPKPSPQPATGQSLLRAYDKETGVLCYYGVWAGSGISCLPAGSFRVPEK